MSHNTWMHRGVRVAIRPLVASPITPNQVTTPRLAVGLAAALALAHGEETWHDRGAGVIYSKFFPGPADGELARLSGKTSPSGHTYDLVSDSLSNALAFLGLGVGLRAASFGA